MTKEIKSPSQFVGWVKKAKVGDKLVYHTGDSLKDCKMRDEVLRQASLGKIHLSQRRLGPFNFEYTAMKVGDDMSDRVRCMTKEALLERRQEA